MSDIDHAFHSLTPPSEAAFSGQEYRERQGRLRAAMAAEGVDLLYLSAPESMCFATGYQAEWYQTGSSSRWPPASGIAIHVDHDRVIQFDSPSHAPTMRYTTRASEIRTARTHDLLGFVMAELGSLGWLGGRVGLELGSSRPNPSVSARFTGMFEQRGSTVVDATGLVREARRLKSPAELACVREAHRIAEIGMNAAARTLAPGVTELDVYAEMTSAMAHAGGEPAAIALPVLSGAKTVCGHALSSRKIITAGEIVCVDIAGVRNRYHANIARTFSIGEPSAAVVEAIEAAAGAFATAGVLLRPELSVGDLTRALEEYYVQAGIWSDRWFCGGYELGIAFAPDWVGEWVWGWGEDHVGDSPDTQLFEPGCVVNHESNFALPEAAGRTMQINTLVIDSVDGGYLNTIPDGLVVVE